MTLPVVLLSAWLAQKAGHALVTSTLTLIAAFTEQSKATSSVLFCCWSPAGKTYRTFLFSCSWARQLSRMSQLIQGFIARSCCAQAYNTLRTCSTVFVLLQTGQQDNVQLGNRMENLYCAANVRKLHGARSLSSQRYNIFRLIPIYFL